MRSHDHPRIHVLFPTAKEAKNSGRSIYSDHLLLLARVNLGEGCTPIAILDWNVLSANASMTGFHQGGGWETEIEAHARFLRIVTALVTAVKKHNASVITLQEATPKLILQLLKANLPPHWQIFADSTTMLITCWDTKRFSVNTKDIITDTRNRICFVPLIDNLDNHSIILGNLWGHFDPFPASKAAELREILNKHPFCILIGDTNSRIAPIDEEPRNITTGVIPLLMNQFERMDATLQRPDYPDGGFYRGKDGMIHQIPTWPLDYETGAIVKDVRTAPEMKAWPEFRFILCLDDHYCQQFRIQGNTISEFQNTLNARFSESMYVGLASDCYNRKAIGIRFETRNGLYAHLTKTLNHQPGFQTRTIAEANDTGRTYNVIFMSLEHIDTLLNAINTYHTTPCQTPHGAANLFKLAVTQDLDDVSPGTPNHKKHGSNV